MTKLQTIPDKPSRTDVAAESKALGRMFAAFRERSDDAASLTKTYLSALDDLPAWSVIEACDRYVRGRVVDRTSHAFAPSSAELHAVAEQLIVERRAEEERRRRAALPPPRPAPEPNPEMRDRLARQMAELAEGLRAVAAQRRLEDMQRSEGAERVKAWREERLSSQPRSTTEAA